MAKEILYRPIFVKDYKRLVKKHNDRAISEFKKVTQLLATGASFQLLRPYRDHVLKGKYAHMRELHLDKDVLLIYQVTQQQVEFIRLGTHQELLGI